ncbi:MAG: winged helix-turn-helix transcriptional regulator [Deltaproteobacteria bacterium]|nr:winged helix-turn-helix transcriptional regulator [Deltaproteobacteria bacterium]
MDESSFERRARVIKAMAHPSRLQMIDALSEGERCVCELQRLVGADMSTVSKHLSLMKRAGLVADRKQGLQVFYRLKVPCILRFFDCVDAVLRNGSARARTGT